MGIKFNPLIFSGFDNSGGGAASIGIGTPIAGSTPYSILSVDGSSSLSERGPLTDGQLLIGSTGTAAVAASLTGTVNQLTVTSGAGSITLSLPQNIHTAAVPQFSAITLSSANNQVNLSSGANLLTINSGTSVAARQYTVPDAGVSANFVMSESAQTINGSKTFSNNVLTPGIDSASVGGTVGVGFVNASVINIGNSGAVVNIQGTTNQINVTNYNVSDKNITINSGGAVSSASGSGLEIEEATVITGYATIDAGRTSWQLKAPATAGVVLVTPGASGFTIDQGSHNPVSFTTPGLGITFNSGTQALSAQLASTSQPGLLSSADFTTFNNKANSNLGNLTSTAINQSLLPDTDSSRNIGSLALKFNALFTNGIYNGSYLAYNVASNIMLDSLGVNSILANSRELRDSSNLTAINYNNRTLNDSLGNPVLNHSGTNIDILSRKIVNVVDPTANQDAATKKYVDDGLVALNAANKTLSNLTTTSINADLIPDTDDSYSIGAPSLRFSAYISSIYDDNNSPAITIGTSTRDLIATSGNTVASFAADDLSLNNNKIINLDNPASPQDAATKSYVDGLSNFNAGDIQPASFSAANNQIVAADVTGLLFNPLSVRSFDILLSVAIDATSDLFEQFKLNGIYNGVSWYLNSSSVGDSSGIVFSITNAGQVQYTSTNVSGFVSSTFRFRAQTT